MKRTRLLLLIGVITTGIVLGVAAASQPLQDSTEIERFREELAALRRRVESLEKQVKDRSIVIPKQNGRQGPIVIQPYRSPREIPKDWKPFDFNGMQYYIVPVNNGHTSQACPPGDESPQTVPTTENQ